MARAFVRSLLPGARNLADPDQRLAYLILASTVPAALIGFFLENLFETVVRSPWVVVFNLVLVGFLFIVAEAMGSRSRQADKLGFSEAVGIGRSNVEPISKPCSRAMPPMKPSVVSIMMRMRIA